MAENESKWCGLVDIETGETRYVKVDERAWNEAYTAEEVEAVLNYRGGTE